MPDLQPTGLHTTSVGRGGPRIAFLHGLFGQGRNWNQIAKSLDEQVGGVQALLVDLPDHGRSPWSTEFSFIGYADQVAQTLRDVGGADRWTLIGHSLGGKVAMVVALRHPELIERLGVVDIAPKSYGNLHRFSGYIEGMRAMPLTQLASRADAEEWFTTVEPDPGVRAFLLQNLRRNGTEFSWQANLELIAADAARGSDSAIADFPDLVADTAYQGPFAGPVLWLNGGDSEYVAPDDTEQMRALFPKVRTVTVKGAGHWVHTQSPDVTVEALARLLGWQP